MTKISELTSIVTAAATDIIAVVQDGVTKQVTVQDYIDEGVLAAPGGGGAVDSVNGQTGAVVLDAADVGAVTLEPFQMKVFYIGGANPTNAASITSAFQGFIGRAPNADPTHPDIIHFVDFGSANTIYLLSALGSSWYGINLKTGAAVSFL